jgi:hypothetical protein
MDTVPHDDLPDVDPGNDSTADLREIHALLSEHISRIASLIHYTGVVPPGRQWAIPMGLDCGFDGELVIRVRNPGTCGRDAALAEGER